MSSMNYNGTMHRQKTSFNNKSDFRKHKSQNTNTKYADQYGHYRLPNDSTRQQDNKILTFQ